MVEIQSATHQLALALFEEYAPRGDSVKTAPSDLGFRRSHAFTKIVDLSLAARRLIDVAYFIVADRPEIQPEYRIDFGLFRWLLCTTSSNRAHLTKLIREAQKGAIELNEIDAEDPSRDRWGAIPLMGPAFVANGQFIFELPERLQYAIKHPTGDHFLSLRYVFKSIHSKILYDRLQPYMAEGTTPWFNIKTLRVWLECEKKTYDTFKYFRNKVLDVAISEILEVTGVSIEILTNNQPGSKRIAELRFKINAPTQPEQKTALAVLKALHDTLRNEFGLHQTHFNTIIANRSEYTDERIQKAIEYTRHYAERVGIQKSAAGYFMKALREGYILGELDKKSRQKQDEADKAKKDVENEVTEIQERNEADAAEKARKERDMGLDALERLPPDEQAQLVNRFTKAPAAILVARKLKVTPPELAGHLTDPVVRAALGTFVTHFMRLTARKIDSVS